MWGRKSQATRGEKKLPFPRIFIRTFFFFSSGSLPPCHAIAASRASKDLLGLLPFCHGLLQVLLSDDGDMNKK